MVHRRELTQRKRKKDLCLPAMLQERKCAKTFARSTRSRIPD